MISQTSAGSYISGAGTAPAYEGQIFTLNNSAVVTGFGTYTLGGTSPFCAWSVKFAIFDMAGNKIVEKTFSGSDCNDSSVHERILNWDSPVNLNAQKYYLGVQFISGASNSLYGSASNPYAGGCAGHYSGSGSISECDPTPPRDIQDIGFNLYGDFSAGSISIIYPISTSTPIEEFTNWVVQVTTATSTTATSSDFYTKQIYIGSSASNLTTLSAGTSQIPATSTLLIYKPSALGLGTWYAQAELRYFTNIYDEGTLVTSSSIISFIIDRGFGATGSWGSPTSTASSSEWTLTCDQSDGFFAKSLCFLAQALFIPSNDSTSIFQNVGDLVKTKPPMGYFTQIKNAISNLSSTASSTLSLPDLSGMNSTLFNPLKAILQLGLWFLFGFWLFNRMRHLEL